MTLIIRPLVLVYCLQQATLSIFDNLCWRGRTGCKLHRLSELLLTLASPYDQDTFDTFYNSAVNETNPVEFVHTHITGLNVVPAGEKFKPK